MARVLIVGHGSIGARHARLLSAEGHAVQVVSAQAGLPYPTHGEVTPALLAETDYVVIAKATTEHAAHLGAVMAMGYGGPLLVEKPLFDSIAEAAQVPRERSFYVGFNLRFLPIVQDLTLRLGESGERPLSARLCCGSYLPNWRPGRDYRQTSSALRASGGGVTRDLSHELDMARLLFGVGRNVAARGGKVSDLEIETEDLVEILYTAEACPVVSIHLNYVERVARRWIEVVTNQASWRANLLTGQLTREGEVLADHGPIQVDGTYLAMHAEAMAGNPKGLLCTREQAEDDLRLADAVHAGLPG